MEYRRMGRTGLQLSVLSYGSWVTFHGQLADDRADALMGQAYDAGINFFDNAEGYAHGESERMMGRVLRARQWDRTSYVLSSKVYFGARKENKPNQAGLSTSSRPATKRCSACRPTTSTSISATAPIPTCLLKKRSGPCTS
jgi:aryl-alcohol dehydrogenase-like predicted oxidoreductase